MEKQNVEKIIKKLIKEKLNASPSHYEIKDGLATSEASEKIQDVAISCFAERNESEIERDENLGITKIDYVDWAMDQFSEWVQNEIEDNYNPK